MVEVANVTSYETSMIGKKGHTGQGCVVIENEKTARNSISRVVGSVSYLHGCFVGCKKCSCYYSKETLEDRKERG